MDACEDIGNLETILVIKQGYSGNWINNMVADAMAPRVTRPAAVIIIPVKYRWYTGPCLPGAPLTNMD